MQSEKRASGIHTSLEHEPCGRHGTYRAINNHQERGWGGGQVKEIVRQLGSGNEDVMVGETLVLTSFRQESERQSWF